VSSEFPEIIEGEEEENEDHSRSYIVDANDKIKKRLMPLVKRYNHVIKNEMFNLWRMQVQQEMTYEIYIELLENTIMNVLCKKYLSKLYLYSQMSCSPSSSSQQQQHQTSLTNSTPIITTQTINKFISKPFVLFTTFTVVLCIYNFFNGDNTSNSYSAITNMTYNGMFNSYYQSSKIRHLNQKTVEISSTEIERLNLTMGGMFISFGDYYTLMNYKGKETFLNRDKMYSFKNLGKVMLINENDLTNQNVRNGCMNNKCIVEITSDNVQIKEGSPMLIKLLFNTNIYEKSNSNSNNNNNNDNYQQNTSTFLYEIDCQAIGFRKHLLNDTFKNIPTIHT
jgi:hypothetical protein